MEVNSDFSDLLSAFNDAGVKYLVVGGHAVAIHDQPRFTKDIDIWIESTPDNAARTLQALVSFGAPMQDVAVEDFVNDDVVFQVGVEPVRVDIMSSITGVSFAQAWPDRVETTYGDVPVTIIGKAALIANKTATGRPQDLVDVQNLSARP